MAHNAKGPGDASAGPSEERSASEACNPSSTPSTDNRPSLSPSPDVSIDFLEKLRPGGPWVLTAIIPDGTTTTETVTAAQGVRRFIEQHNVTEKENVYYSTAVLRRAMSKKAKKVDVKAIEYLHVDADPDRDESPEEAKARYLQAIEQFTEETGIKFTALVDSGNGIQGLIKLTQRVELGPLADGKFSDEDQAKVDDVEARSGTLMLRIGANPETRNVDRILRLPGTVNWPNKKKRNRGRTPCLSKLIYFNSATTPLEDLPKDAPEVDLGDTTVAGGAEDRLESLIRDGCGDQFGGHRARAVWFVIMEMFRRGYYDEAIVEVLTNRANRISDHIYDQSDPEGYAERQVRQAKEDAEFATHNGVPVKSPGNICIAMVKLSVTVRYDKFADRIMVEGVDGFGPVLDDAAVHRLWLTMDRQLRFRPNLDMLFLVISDVARLNEFHPVCDYLDGLQWDGVKRIDRWLTTYGRAEDTEYTSAVGALVLMAAVRRVRQPGCKFDEMLVLEAPQGKERSTALAILAVRDEWFSDDLPLHVDAQKLIERTRGRWIIECAELSGMKRADIEHIKALLSRQRDRARMVWRKITADAPRQFVPIGTTNSDRYLKDQTGNRRFWPAKTPKFDLDALRRDRDQLWAEAAAREATGASIRLPQHLWEKAEEVQEARLIHDPIYDALHDAIGEFDKGKIAATAIWTILDVRVGAQGQDHNMRVSQAMKNLGWERAPSTIRINGKAVKGYTKGEQPWPQISVERTGPEKFLSVWAGTSTSVTPEENTDLDPRIEVPLYVEEPLPEDERQFLFVPVNLSGEAPLYVEDEGEG